MATPTSNTLIRKRDGRIESFDRRKIEHTLRTLSWGLDTDFMDINTAIAGIVNRLPTDTMTSETFQVFAAEVVSTFSSLHPDYSVLAGRVYTGYIHKRVPKRFSTWALSQDYTLTDGFAYNFIQTVRDHAAELDAAIVHYRDFGFTYHAMQSFHKSYLLRRGKEVNERLQFMYMRVAIGIHGDSILDVLETYELLSTGKISLASPILRNGGLYNRHYSSAYIYDPYAVEPVDAVSNLSALSGLWSSDAGIGIHAGEIPATRRAHDGKHPGLMPLLRVYDSLAGFWARSSQQRTASATIYLPIWHADVRKLVLSRTNRASLVYRFRNLFPALWIPDLFMRRLHSGGSWSLFDPSDVRSLTDLVGDAFDAAYESHEEAGRAVATIPAKSLWDTVTHALRESGTPFLLFSDNINSKNNQRHLGVIKASNLCTEIVQHSSPIETAVCTLASLCLPSFVRPNGVFDYDELHRVTKILVRILDSAIDQASFPTGDSAISAYNTRSIAIGAQGLADVFAMAELPFTSPQARALNVRIYETIYHASLDSSCEISQCLGHYDSWDGSPASQGLLQMDMWGTEPSDRYDFDTLRQRISQHGLRNSMLTAQMPTSATARLLGNSEGIEPRSSNIFQYRVLSGTFNELSRHLVNSLRRRGLWTEGMRNDIIAACGSVQDIASIPQDLKAVFRTAFELNPHDLIDMAADRSPFIDQSQSFSLFIAQPTASITMDLALHAWRSGLKTGAYYVRSKAPSDPQPFSIPRSFIRNRAASPRPSFAATSTSTAGSPSDT